MYFSIRITPIEDNTNDKSYRKHILMQRIAICNLSL